METVWVAVLSISTRTANKIIADHQIEPDEVRDAVCCIAGLQVRWDDSPTRGLRAIVSTRIRERACAIVLYPTEQPMGDAWRLGSAYFVD